MSEKIEIIFKIHDEVIREIFPYKPHEYKESKYKKVIENKLNLLNVYLKDHIMNIGDSFIFTEEFCSEYPGNEELVKELFIYISGLIFVVVDRLFDTDKLIVLTLKKKTNGREFNT